MDPLITLLLFSAAMLIGCYLAGSIPLVVPMSKDRMEVVSVLGAGLLVGTALTVIIPEGINTLLMSHHSHHDVHPSPSQSSNEAAAGGEHLQQGMEKSIGLALVLGFILMLLIDQCAGSHHHPDPESNLTRGSRTAWTATLGLIVHAAADGIALGAAVASSHTEVEVIVFFAIMLHKAPAAFGLVTFLLHENLEIRRIRRHLIMFAVAAPAGACLTFLVIVKGGQNSLSSSNSAGLAMLFSAGTFLYVSTVHVLPELLERNSSSSLENGNQKSPKQFSRKQLVALVFGSLLPSILTLGHHH